MAVIVTDPKTIRERQFNGLHSRIREWARATNAAKLALDQRDSPGLRRAVTESAARMGEYLDAVELDALEDSRAMNSLCDRNRTLDAALRALITENLEHDHSGERPALCHAIAVRDGRA